MSRGILIAYLFIDFFFLPCRPGGHLWESPKQSARTGGANWSPSVTGANYAPQQSIPTMVSVSIYELFFLVHLYLLC